MKLRFALFAGLLLLASACADLQAVQDYAKASASVPGYDEATKDFGNRFSRTEVYLDEKSRKLSQSLSTERQRAVPDLLAVHKNLQSYMLVLGKLAGAQTFDLGKQTEGLQKQVVAFPPFGLDGGTANAAGDLGRLVAKWALMAVQQKSVIELVTEADPVIQTVTSGMRRIVGEYRKDLDDERRTVGPSSKPIAYSSRASFSSRVRAGTGFWPCWRTTTSTRSWPSTTRAQPSSTNSTRLWPRSPPAMPNCAEREQPQQQGIRGRAQGDRAGSLGRQGPDRQAQLGETGHGWS